MRNKTRAGITLVVFVGLSIGACAGSLGAGSPDAGASGLTRTCQLTISTGATTYVAGDDVAVEVTTTNQTADTYKVLDVNALNTYDVNVSLEPKGTPVGRTAYGAGFSGGMHSIRVQKIMPGCKVTRRVNLSRCFDMSRTGVYRMVFSQKIEDENSTLSSIQSNELEVTITDESPADYRPKVRVDPAAAGGRTLGRV